MQLGLQDFGVQLKTVQMGPDVIASATEFKPDIIFIDVLLQKKSGYEVAHELKTSAEFGSIPVVLMWSGFMEFSEEKAKATGAEGRLEKPFDSEILRNVTKDLVPRLKQHALSGFLSTPFISKPDLTSAGAGNVAAQEVTAATPQPSEIPKAPAIPKTPQTAVTPVAPRPASTPQPVANPAPGTSVKPVPVATAKVSAPIPSAVKPVPIAAPRPAPLAQPSNTPKPAVPMAPVAPVAPKAESWSMDDFPSPPIPGIDSEAPTNPGVPEDEFTSQPLAPLDEQPIAIEIDTQANTDTPAKDPDEEWQKKDFSNFTVNVPLNQLNGEVDVQINPDIDADVDFKTSVQQRFGNTGNTAISASAAKVPSKIDSSSQGAVKVHPHYEKELKARQARETATGPEKSMPARPSAPAASPSSPSLSAEDMKQIVESQTEELIREMIQKIVPEMATRLIQAEIDRLLSERGPTE